MPFPRLSDVPVAAETLFIIGREQRISADSHMTEPPDLWEKRLPPALRDRAPRFPNRDTDSGNVRVGGWDPYERLYNDGQLPPPADPPGDVKDLEAWNKVHWHE